MATIWPMANAQHAQLLAQHAKIHPQHALPAAELTHSSKHKHVSLIAVLATLLIQPLMNAYNVTQPVLHALQLKSPTAQPVLVDGV
jgi:hypothetical protein